MGVPQPRVGPARSAWDWDPTWFQAAGSVPPSAVVGVLLLLQGLYVAHFYVCGKTACNGAKLDVGTEVQGWGGLAGTRWP